MTTNGVRRLRRTGGLAVVAALLFVGPALADDNARAVTAAPTDADIQSDVVNAVLGYVHYGVFDSVGVGVEDGAVTLTGSVVQPWHKDDLQKRVAKLEGVREVKNQIRVQPVSIFDDRLRVQLYRQIYGSGMFQRYASFANPPIHIIVENGNITLTGLVNSQVEKAVLGSIARGTLAFRVDNLVQIESELHKEPVKAPARS
jgi:hyperosmotically inducible protein